MLLNDDLTNRITDNASSEYITCAAYFKIVGMGFAKAGDIETSEAYRKSFETAWEYALIFAQDQRTEDMALKVSLSRFNMYRDRMLIEINRNYSNISILSAKHAFPCKFALENPIQFVEEIGSRTILKHKRK